MTVIVGILCSDGVVLGADTVLTHGGNSGSFTMEHAGALKLEVLPGPTITAIAGCIGLSQRANEVVRKLKSGKSFRSSSIVGQGMAVAKAVIEDFRKTESPYTDQREGWGCGMLMGVVVNDQPQLVEFDPVNFTPEVKGYIDPARGDRLGRFATLGSGQGLADPFLAHAYRLLFGEEVPTVARARLAVVWTLEHVIRYNVGGVGGELKLAILEKDPSQGDWGARYLDPGETRQQVEALEQHIRSFGPDFLEKLEVDPIDV